MSPHPPKVRLVLQRGTWADSGFCFKCCSWFSSAFCNAERRLQPPLCLSWCQRVLVRAAGAPTPSVAHATYRKCPPPCSGSSDGASGLLFLQFPSCFLPGSPRNPGMCPVLQQRSFPLDCVLLGGNQHFWHLHCHQGDELRSLTACFVAKMHPVLVLKLLSGYLPWSSLVCKKLQIPFPKYSLWVFIYTSYRMCVLPSRLTIFRD